MREIKFRAWDNKGKCMVDWSCMRQTAFNNHKMNLMYDIFCGHRLDTELMQFTGLTDKNGKDIYEGDIVNYEWVEDHSAQLVKWDEERAQFGFQEQGENEPIYGVNAADVSERAEIIGNIYENQELLETTQEAG